MRTVQMTLDDELVEKVDQIVREIGSTRSAFTRQALHQAVEHYQTRLLEERHIKGYVTKPVNDDEFSVWEEEQEWGDA